MIQQFHSGQISGKVLSGKVYLENSNLKRYTQPPMFTAALLTITKTWMQPKYQ